MGEPPNAEEDRQNEDSEPTIEGSRMPLTQHLAELAVRLRRSLYAFIIAFAVVSSLPNPYHPFGGDAALFGYDFLVIALIRRAEDLYAKNFGLIATTVTSPISIFLNVSLALALVFSMPVIFNQIYGFIAPGLYQRERKAVRKYIVPFAVLFALGGVFGLVVVFPIVMHILLSFFAPFNLASLLPLNDFINLLLLVPVVTGLAFTFPVYIIPLVELKVIDVKQLSGARKWVYVGVALIVGLVNPDPTFISSIPIIIPIYVLFEITVFIAKRIESKRAKAAGGAEIVPP